MGFSQFLVQLEAIMTISSKSAEKKSTCTKKEVKRLVHEQEGFLRRRRHEYDYCRECQTCSLPYEGPHSRSSEVGWQGQAVCRMEGPGGVQEQSLRWPSWGITPRKRGPGSEAQKMNSFCHLLTQILCIYALHDTCSWRECGTTTSKTWMSLRAAILVSAGHMRPAAVHYASLDQWFIR